MTAEHDRNSLNVYMTFNHFVASTLFLSATVAIASDFPEGADLTVTANGTDILSIHHDNTTMNTDPDVLDGAGWVAAGSASAAVSLGTIDIDYTLNWTHRQRLPSVWDNWGSFLSNTVTITNNTASDQAIDIVAETWMDSIGLPHISMADIAFVRGTLHDADGNGAAALNVSVGSSLYHALISDALDDDREATLFDGPRQWTVNDPGGDTEIPLASGSLHDSFYANGPLVISNAFTLSAGDSITLESFYAIAEEIPAPGGLAAIFTAVVITPGRRRR